MQLKRMQIPVSLIATLPWIAILALLVQRIVLSCCLHFTSASFTSVKSAQALLVSGMGLDQQIGPQVYLGLGPISRQNIQRILEIIWQTCARTQLRCLYECVRHMTRLVTRRQQASSTCCNPSFLVMITLCSLQINIISGRGLLSSLAPLLRECR